MYQDNDTPKYINAFSLLSAKPMKIYQVLPLIDDLPVLSNPGDGISTNVGHIITQHVM